MFLEKQYITQYAPVVIKIILTIASIVILFIPYAEVFWPGDEAWVKTAIADDEIILLFYAPYALLCIFYWWQQRFGWIKIVLLIITLVYTCLWILGTGMAMQDIVPTIGSLIILGWHGMVLVWLLFSNRLLQLLKAKVI